MKWSVPHSLGLYGPAMGLCLIGHAYILVYTRHEGGGGVVHVGVGSALVLICYHVGLDDWEVLCWLIEALLYGMSEVGGRKGNHPGSMGVAGQSEW